MAIAGKVAITLSTENGGAWSADVTYDRLVAVKHNNNLYISRKTVANVEPPNNEFWFLALEGFSGDDIEDIINGTTPVGNANLLEGLTAEQVGASGARNLIPYPYHETTHTEDGITWVDNGDGTFTANGTATANSEFSFVYSSNAILLKAGTYTLSGCPEGGKVDKTYFMLVNKSTGNKERITQEDGNGVTFTISEDTSVYLQARVVSGVTVENLTFRPMLELGSVDHDYVPYHLGGAEDAKTINGFAVYTDVSQLGIASYNVIDISNAMPVNSKFIGSVVSGFTYAEDATNLLPSNNGVLEITKSANAKRRNIVFYSGGSASKDNVYICDINENANTINGWKHIGDGGNAKTLDGHEAEDFAKETDLANYLPKTGGTVTGTSFAPLKIDSTDAYSLIQFLQNGGSRGLIGFRNQDDTQRLLYIPSDWNAEYYILHTGNKPTGSYTGNGSEELRTIRTGGIGNMVVILADNSVAFVTSEGAFHDSDEGIFMQDVNSKFINGDINIISKAWCLNADGNRYYYFVV